jgi:hypothetical protein
VTVLIVVVAVFAALAGAAAVWWRWDTGRQPRVGDVVARMNRAVADVVVAAGPDAAFAVSPVVRSTQCRLGFLRQGGIFTAKADLYTDPGAEDALITAITGRLPAGYAATRGPQVAGVSPLRATAGTAVTVAVQRVSPGWLSVTARSGCSLGTATPPAAAATGTGVTALTGLLRQLGTAPASLTEQQVQCTQGDIVTVAAVSGPVDSSQLATRLRAAIPAGARQFQSGESNRVVYRSGDTAVIIAASDDGTAVTAQYTTLC